jgi:hypothetical protein
VLAGFIRLRRARFVVEKVTSSDTTAAPHTPLNAVGPYLRNIDNMPCRKLRGAGKRATKLHKVGKLIAQRGMRPRGITAGTFATGVAEGKTGKEG